MKRMVLTVLAGLFCASTLPAAKTLDMWLVDVEGGKALLLVSPSGQSMLIDTGFPPRGDNARDTNRILEAAQAAGVKRIDVLVTTHYDGDHVNNTPDFVAKMPVELFVDHGSAHSRHDRLISTAAIAAYQQLWPKAKHLVVKPGDKIPFDGVDVLVVTAGGDAIKTPVKGGGAPNPACAGVERMTWNPSGDDQDITENALSVGLLFTYGQFRMLDLADLTWNKELELMCPNNPIGAVDLFMVSHHGNDISNSPALVNGIQPRVALMNNGARKAARPAALNRLKAAPRLQALYLAHWSALAPDDNPPNEFIANLQDSLDGKWIKASASEDGTIVVTNGRTGESKTYKR